MTDTNELLKSLEILQPGLLYLDGLSRLTLIQQQKHLKAFFHTTLLLKIQAM